MIEVFDPYIREVENGAVRLEVQIAIDGISKNLWVEVENKYKDFLSFERCDAYVIALLPFAMRNGHDIKCHTPMSGDLHYQLTTYLIKALALNSPRMYETKIISAIDESSLPCFGAVGTGISCGVDSLHVLALQSGTNYKKQNVTHLAIHNVGSHDVQGNSAHKLFKGRIELARQFCNEYAFELVVVDSNLSEVIEQNHSLTHFFANMFAVYVLRKLYRIYYYASGEPLQYFSIKDNDLYDCCLYEIYSTSMLSVSSLRIYSEASAITRYQKTVDISTYRPSYKYLNVCVFEKSNCGKCDKCIRTLLTLDAIGVLDNYKDVFNIQYYKDNKDFYLRELYKRHLINDQPQFFYEIYQKLGNQISFICKISVLRSSFKEILASKIKSNFLLGILRFINRFIKLFKK